MVHKGTCIYPSYTATTHGSQDNSLLSNINTSNFEQIQWKDSLYWIWKTAAWQLPRDVPYLHWTKHIRAQLVSEVTHGNLPQPLTFSKGHQQWSERQEALSSLTASRCWVKVETSEITLVWKTDHTLSAPKSPEREKIAMMQSRTQTEVILGKSPTAVNRVRTEKAGSEWSSLHKRMNGSNEQNKSKCSLMMEPRLAVLLSMLLEESLGRAKDVELNWFILVFRGYFVLLRYLRGVV